MHLVAVCVRQIRAASGCRAVAVDDDVDVEVAVLALDNDDEELDVLELLQLCEDVAVLDDGSACGRFRGEQRA